jgi:hypothetical protein
VVNLQPVSCQSCTQLPSCSIGTDYVFIMNKRCTETGPARNPVVAAVFLAVAAVLIVLSSVFSEVVIVFVGNFSCISLWF